MIGINKNYNEDCIKTMSNMPNGLIDFVVTSPEYDNLRKYDGDHPWNSAIWKSIIKELYRVMKSGGVVVWVVGDATVKGSETLSSFKQAIYFVEQGFRLHDTMIYKKNGASFPAGKNSVRYSQVFEYMFVFSKGKPKTINLLKDRKNRWAGHTSFGKSTNRNTNGTLTEGKRREIGDFGYRYNIWKYNRGKGFGGDDISFSNPATFPEKLAEDHILSWSNEGDLIYDPFMGSGTTAKMAIANNRRWIGSEISIEYCKGIDQRINHGKKKKKKESIVSA